MAILMERELFAAAKLAIKRASISDHFELLGAQMLAILVDEI
jgi:hypothetical protein